MARKRKKPSEFGDDTPPVERERQARYQRVTGDVARARKVRQQWERDYLVEQLEQMFIQATTAGQRTKHFNHAWATLKVNRPNLFYTAPKFYVRPRPGRSSPVAQRTTAIAESVLLAISERDAHLKKSGRMAVTQAYTRLGALKIVYDPRVEANPNAGQPIQATNPDGSPRFQEDGVTPVYVMDPFTQQPILEPAEVPTDEIYRFDWVDAANLLLPDEGPDPAKWTWIGEEIVVPLEQAKQDTRFPADKRERLKANATRHEPRQDRAWSSRAGSDETERFRYVEVYHLRDKTWCVWADGQDWEDFLLEGPIPAWIDDHPYAILSLGEPILGPTPCPWPFPPTRPWLDIQQEYDIRRKQITEGCKRAARKIYFDEGTFPNEDEARKALASADDLTAVKINDINRPPTAQTDPSLPPDLYKDLMNLQADWRIITGQTGARLADPEGGTATEATYAERGANIREADEKGLVDDWLSIAGSKMLQCIKQTLTLGLWVELTEMDDRALTQYMEQNYQIPREMLLLFPGLKDMLKQRFGERKWVSVTREDLTFDADVTVAVGSTRPRNLDAERRAWMEFLRVLGQAPQLALSRALLEKTAAMFEIDDEPLLDELTALAKQMVGINANQAGRNQGGNVAQNGQPEIGGMLQTLLSGAAQTAGVGGMQ